MNPKQIALKFYVEGNPNRASKDFLPIFHRWIQESVLPELLIDVTDYGHVHHGPGAMLIGHESNYAMDSAEGRLGLLYARKQGVFSSLEENLFATLKATARAARLLEEDPSLKGLRFRTDEILFRIHDRLLAPNTQTTWNAIEPILRSAVKQLFPKGDATLEWLEAPKECFSVAIRAAANEPLQELQKRIS